jgi:hypothetical protein
MHATHEFEILYRDLSEAWEDHQSLRYTRPSLAELVESSMRLERARSAMRDWHACRESITI